MKPFLTGRPAVSGAALRPVTGAESTKGGVGHGAHAGGPTPVVETVKQGDKVARIIVTCSCGERIEIDCLYPPGT